MMAAQAAQSAAGAVSSGVGASSAAAGGMASTTLLQAIANSSLAAQAGMAMGLAAAIAAATATGMAMGRENNTAAAVLDQPSLPESVPTPAANATFAPFAPPLFCGVDTVNRTGAVEFTIQFADEDAIIQIEMHKVCRLVGDAEGSVLHDLKKISNTLILCLPLTPHTARLGRPLRPCLQQCVVNV